MKDKQLVAPPVHAVFLPSALDVVFGLLRHEGEAVFRGEGPETGTEFHSSMTYRVSLFRARRLRRVCRALEGVMRPVSAKLTE